MWLSKFLPYFAYNVGGWVQKVGKMCLRNKSMTPNLNKKKLFSAKIHEKLKGTDRQTDRENYCFERRLVVATLLVV